MILYAMPRATPALAAVAVIVAAIAFAGCAAPVAAPVPLPVPEALRPDATLHAVLNVGATGVQIYECRPGAGGAAPAWAFVAPEAVLLDERGQALGSHGAGPFWLANDGSRVVGSVAARADAPVPGAIPWLLLSTRSTGSAGVFSPVAAIQRINTVGGTAPAGGCDALALGQQARVPYRADYRLFAAR
jgi:hypothetical protein